MYKVHLQSDLHDTMGTGLLALNHQSLHSPPVLSISFNLIVELGGSLVHSMPFVQRIVGSNPALAEM